MGEIAIGGLGQRGRQQGQQQGGSNKARRLHGVFLDESNEGAQFIGFDNVFEGINNRVFMSLWNSCWITPLRNAEQCWRGSQGCYSALPLVSGRHLPRQYTEGNRH